MICHACGCPMIEVPHFDPPRWIKLWLCDCDLSQVLIPLAYAERITIELEIPE
jgi:hypothetical protein